MPLDDVGDVGVRGRIVGDHGLQVVHARSEMGFDPCGEHAYDVFTDVGYVVRQRERFPFRKAIPEGKVGSSQASR
ncbi:hypothetical protein GCM10017667_67340 [Streptomyces filamentosus]|uniref:Uncharacterized protein n=1 Tax=Streptomyces filamentosus TaxID=67294 RepID=A0A919ESY9_STRFL|nr:hypothetical protein GCM10017667_67340 [Streptomyces filamentosus]